MYEMIKWNNWRKTMKNIKKLLGVLAIALFVLVGCGSNESNGINETVDTSELTIDERLDLLEENTKKIQAMSDDGSWEENEEEFQNLVDETGSEGIAIAREIASDLTDEEFDKTIVNKEYYDEVFDEKQDEQMQRANKATAEIYAAILGRKYN